MKGNPLIYVMSGTIVFGVIFVVLFNLEPDVNISTSLPPTASQTPPLTVDEDTESEAVVAVGSRIKELETRQVQTEDSINKRLDDLTELLQTLQNSIETQAISPPVADVPSPTPSDGEGQLNLETLIPALPTGEIDDPETEFKQKQWIWIEDQSGLSNNIDETGFDETILVEQGDVILSSVTPTAQIDEKSIPRHVIPPTTVIEGVTLTAAIGRIPIRGKVDDVWPVKIISTPKGYAPNGYEINAGAMIWEGTAFGDANLSCVSITLLRVASVLPGRIMSFVESQDESGFGYITDEYGNPCLGGELISNIGQQLTINALLGTIQGLGSAYADAERTRTTSAEGNTVESVTGDELRVLLGEAIAGAAEGASDYLANRSDTWDAIYVPPEQKVIINIKQPLDFQYDKNQKLFDFARFTMQTDHNQSADLD